MFCICVLIIAAAAVYMVEAYIHTYYAIEYMHGAPLFFVLLAKYAAPVLFLLLCVYFVFRYREKRRESEKPAQDKQENREEVYAEKINATVKTKAVFSDQADQMLYQVMRFGRQLSSATARISPISSATCLTQKCNPKARFYPRSCSKRQPPRGEQRATGDSPGKLSLRRKEEVPYASTTGPELSLFYKDRPGKPTVLTVG